MKTLLYIAMSAFIAVSPSYARNDSLWEKAERDRRERNARIEANNRERERLNRERNALITRFNSISVNADFSRTKSEISLAAQTFKDNPTAEFVNFTNRITNIIKDYRTAYKEASGYAANPDSAIPSEFLASLIRLEEVSGSLNRELDAFARLRNEQEQEKRTAELNAAWMEKAVAEREASHRRNIELMAVAHSNAVVRAKEEEAAMNARAKAEDARAKAEEAVMNARAKAEEAAMNARLAELDRKIEAEAEEAARIREEKRREEAQIRMEERQFQLELARIQSGRGSSSSMLLLSTLLSAFVSLGIGCGVGFVVWGRRREAK